ncbi:MAG TPA: TadE family protein [Natronosporangium sp.]|nr:TadE family protein [Natronosporangium sp.]
MADPRPGRRRWGTRCWGTRRRAPRWRDRGAAPIELAIVWPAILLLVFGAVQVATYFTARTVALSAAQVGVTAARGYDATDADGRDRAEAFLAQAGDWLVDWQVIGPVRDETTGQVTVTVTGDALTLVPGYNWEVRQTAHGTIERFSTP